MPGKGRIYAGARVRRLVEGSTPGVVSVVRYRTKDGRYAVVRTGERPGTVFEDTVPVRQLELVEDDEEVGAT